MSTGNSPSPKAYTASSKQIWFWGIGAIATHLLIQTYGQANTIFIVGYGLSPVIVGWCMLLPRFVDGIMDPIMGHLSDNTRTRWGRRKPFLVVGAVTGMAFLVALWWANPGWSHTAQFAYLLICGTLFYVAFGIYSMAWTALGYELTDDYNERSKVAAIAGLFLALCTFGAQWMYWLALRPLFHEGVMDTLRSLWASGSHWNATAIILAHSFSGEGHPLTDEITGMRWIAAIVGVLILGAALVTTLGCKERFTHVNRTHVPILPALKATISNRPFVILLAFRTFQILMERASMGSLLIFITIYLVCSGDKDSATRLTGIGASVGTVLGFGVLWGLKGITEWIGKRSAQIFSAWVTLGMAILLPFILTSAHPSWVIIPSLVIIPLGTLNATLIGSMLPDICDIDELENDQRREGLFTAVLGFVTKVVLSLSVLLVSYTLSWAGFDTKFHTQSHGVLEKLFWFCVISNLLFSAAYVLLTILFPVTPKLMAEVRRKLDERRLLKAEEGIPTDEVAEEFVHEHPELKKDKTE